jgi:hypothetical protein
MLETILSGGQTGADQAAWRAAKAAGIVTGGWMPMGFRTEGPAAADAAADADTEGSLGPDESHPEFAELYGARSLESLEYRVRTRANVHAARALAWFGDPQTRDGRLTLGLAEMVDIPVLVVTLGSSGSPIDPPTRLADWLRARDVGTLLIAGNRESKAPGIGAWVEAYLAEVFALLGFPHRP